MLTMVIVLIASALAAAGALTAEWWRLRRSWFPGIAVSYTSAALIAISIVMTQVVWNWLDQLPITAATADPLLGDLLIVLVVGPALHGVTWLLLLQAWGYLLQTWQFLRRRAPSGSRPPRG